MKFILFLNAWQIFLIVIFGQFLGASTFNFPKLDDILPILGFLVYLSYPLTIVIYLIDYLPKKFELNNTFFNINFLIVIGYFSAQFILNGRNYEALDDFKLIPELYIIFALYYIFLFPAKILKSLELNREASLGEYFGYFMQLLLLPVGIWFLQPRVRKAIDSHKS